MTSVKNNLLPPGLVSNLQQVLLSRKGGGGGEEKGSDLSNDDNDQSTEPSTSACVENTEEEDNNNSKPVVLVTNGDGIDSPGLLFLVEALVREGLCNVHVCAPQSWVFLIDFLNFDGFAFFFLFTFVTDMLIKGCLQFLSLEDVMGFEFVLGIWEDGIFLA